MSFDVTTTTGFGMNTLCSEEDVANALEMVNLKHEQDKQDRARLH